MSIVKKPKEKLTTLSFRVTVELKEDWLKFAHKYNINQKETITNILKVVMEDYEKEKEDAH